MPSHPWNLFIKFYRFFVPYHRKQLIALVLTLAGVLLSLINPYLTKLMVDRAIMNKDVPMFLILGGIGTVVFLLNSLATAGAEYITKSIRIRLGFDLNKKIFTHMQRLPLDFFKARSTGEHMFKVNYDVDRVADLLSFVPREAVNIFPKFLCTFLIIAWLDGQMALVALLVLPLVYWPANRMTRRMQDVYGAVVDKSQLIFRKMEEIFSHIYLAKVFGKERAQTRGYLSAVIARMRWEFSNIRLEVLNTLMAGSLNRVIIAVLTLFGGWQVMQGRMTLGTLAAVLVYLAELVLLQNSVVFLVQRVSFGLICGDRLDRLLDQPPQDLHVEGIKVTMSGASDIRFDHVTFGYRAQEIVLGDMAFEMPGGWVALAGASGCGKTTIINLLLGFYRPLQGRIIVGGHDMVDIDLAFWRNQLGVVTQEPFLWDDTLANNLKYARPQASYEEMIGVAQLTGVDDLVGSLPNGYDTLVGERGCLLSEGQKQRIALARALLKKPKILILDEAMSSIDALSEEKITAGIRAISGISLVLVVSHRWSTVSGCDQVLYFNGLLPVVSGKPASLMESDTAFRTLFARQVDHA